VSASTKRADRIQPCDHFCRCHDVGARQCVAHVERQQRAGSSAEGDVVPVVGVQRPGPPAAAVVLVGFEPLDSPLNSRVVSGNPCTAQLNDRQAGLMAVAGRVTEFAFWAKLFGWLTKPPVLGLAEDANRPTAVREPRQSRFINDARSAILSAKRIVVSRRGAEIGSQGRGCSQEIWKCLFVP
jgi:hypothetical protein